MRRSLSVFFLLLAGPSLPSPARSQGAPPRIAVWNPEKGTRESRFKIDLAWLNQVSLQLEQGGAKATRLTSEQINQAQAFSAARFDALFLPGDAFARANTSALQKFAEDGGILVSLGAGRVPFNVGIAKEASGEWTMSPREPTFAWQSGDIYFNVLGLKYIYAPGKHDQGVQHTPSALMGKYLPGAPSITRRLPSNWVVPTVANGVATEIFPLIRSRRSDGRDVVPQMFITRSGKKLGIVAINDLFTRDIDASLWPRSKETIVALARLARDLKSGTQVLGAADKIDLPEDLPPPEPMRHRQPTGSVEPDGARALARWGKFDGASLELGEPLGAGQVLALTNKQLWPRVLQPGASVSLVVPAGSMARHKYLRVRGAYDSTGAVLRVASGEQVLWSEAFQFLDAGGAGNISAPSLVSVPFEFHRILFVPPNTSRLAISNAGSTPIYFDAVQVEERAVAAPRMIMGLGAGFDVMRSDKPVAIAREVSSGWTSMRASTRTQLVGPPQDPKRWNALDTLIDKYLSMGVPLEMLLEGTAQWFAISPERYKNSGGRPHTVAPDPQKYAEIVTRIVGKYGDKIDAYEIWNEADSDQFYRGSDEEYIELFQTIVPIIKRLDPTAKIITTGMAGYKDEFVAALVKNGALGQSDLFAFHPYAGKSPAWDVPFGQIEGSLFSHGIGLEVFCNESGFPWQNSEWFQPPPNFSPTLQAQLLNTAMARLLSNGLSKLSVFHSGGDSHPFGLIDASGKPRAAYAVFADYLPLGQKGGRRLDVSFVASDGTPLRGTYAAAARHDNGSATIVLNPAESDQVQMRFASRQAPSPNEEFNSAGDWERFFGKAQAAGGTVTISPDAGKPYVGFGRTFGVDMDGASQVEITVPEADATWQLSVAGADGKQIVVADNQKAGTLRVDLRRFIAARGVQDVNLTIRALGRTVLDSLRFVPARGPAPTLSSTSGDSSSITFASASGWMPFFGSAKAENGRVLLSPDPAKGYMGFYRDVPLDLARAPIMEIVSARADKAWQASFKGAEGKQIMVADAQGVGTARIDLRKYLPRDASGNWNLTLRAFAPTSFESIRFLPADGAAPATPATAPTSPVAAGAADMNSGSVRVKLRVPMEGMRAGQKIKATARVGEFSASVPVQVLEAGGAAWAELELDLTGRTVITLSP